MAKVLYVLLDQYVKDRKKYKTFDMFYPVLMDYFKSVTMAKTKD